MVSMVIKAIIGALVSAAFEEWNKYQDRKRAERNAVLEREAEVRRQQDEIRKRMDSVSDFTNKHTSDRLSDGTF
jgi:hypothetical protein